MPNLQKYILWVVAIISATALFSFSALASDLPASPEAFAPPQSPVPCAPSHDNKTTSGSFCGVGFACGLTSAGDCDGDQWCNHINPEATIHSCGGVLLDCVAKADGNIVVITGWGPFTLALDDAKPSCGTYVPKTVLFKLQAAPHTNVGSVSMEFTCSECD